MELRIDMRSVGASPTRRSFVQSRSYDRGWVRFHHRPSKALTHLPK